MNIKAIWADHPRDGGLMLMGKMLAGGGLTSAKYLQIEGDNQSHEVTQKVGKNIY